ncbi:MAG TPA: SIS domain-containing protein [Thermomicrobiales bacterium]|nr:SIS domain-containing protein [Thermomicrobiales bacterium]
MHQPTIYREYFRRLYDVIEDMLGSQSRNIETVAGLMANSIAEGGVVHLFGSGHSHMIAEEVFHRAGSLMPLNPMLDPNLTLFGMVNATLLERTSGYARVVIGTHDIREDEVVIVASNSGVNPVPIEAVLEAKARGAKTVAITSDRHYRDAPSRHDSGKRLADVADITIDTCVPRGDALVSIPDVEFPVGGVSSVVGTALINAIVVEATHQLLLKGIAPPVIPTMNLPGGDERMEQLVQAYGKRLPLLRNA